MTDAPSDDALFTLAALLQAGCLARDLTVATAESCTGGLVAHAITEIAGSSGYFQGAVVAYTNDAKQAHLGVSSDVLRAHGAVSAQTAREMALGARRRFGTAVAASVTGVAGPGGGSAAKPVGLVYVGVADAAGEDVRRFVWPFDRGGNKRASAQAVLHLLLERIEGAAPVAVSAASGAQAAS
jgi:PncC family amidohydrolase